MQKVVDASEKVLQIVCVFANTLYNKGVEKYRVLQFSIAILCRANGVSTIITEIEYELEPFGIKGDFINKTIDEIRTICGKDSKTILPLAADMVLQKLYVSGPWGEYLQPKELTELVLSFVKERGCKSIYNPFAGLGSYGLGDFVNSYYATEINFATSNIAKMRLELNGVDYSNYHRGDAFEEWNDYNADCIVATPPFGMPLDAELKRIYHASTAEEYLLSRFIKGNAKYGIFVVSRGVCFNSGGTAFSLRKEICEKRLLEMVINLPSGIFASTGVSTSIIILNRNRSKDNKVQFVDGEALFIKEKSKGKTLDTKALYYATHDETLASTSSVSYKDLFDNDCSFDVARYSSQNLIVDEGQEIIKLGDVLSLDKGEKCEFVGEMIENVIESSNFKDDISLFFSKDVSNHVFVDKTKFKFHGPHLVINMQGKMYIHRGDTDFYVGSALRRLVFSVNETVVDIDYLAMVLMFSSGIQQAFFGAGMARLNPSLLLKYQVVIDSIPSRQLQVIARIKRQYASSEKKRLDIREAGGDLTHMLGMPKDQIGNLIDALMSSETISEEDKEYVKAIDDNFKYMLRLVNTVGVDFNSVSDSPKDFCISKMLKSYLESLQNLKFSNIYSIVDSVLVSDSTTVHCDEDLIRVILDSAFRNAYSHGFEKNFSSENKVLLGCKVVNYEESPFVCITIANNGVPLAPNFSTEDFAARGKKAGKMANTGKGGYHIYSIAKKYNGYINISSSKEWPFMLDVLIPASFVSTTEKIEEYGSKCL